MGTHKYFIDPDSYQHFNVSLHYEMIRKLDFLLSKYPKKEFYISLKVQSSLHPFSSKQIECINQDYQKKMSNQYYKRKKGRKNKKRHSLPL